MKSKLLVIALGFSFLSSAQTTLFQVNFESGSSNWILNSSDLSSIYTHNKFVINDVYVNPTTFSFNCSGLDLTPTINTTAAQPSTYESANQNYLHITSVLGDAAGANNAHYISKTSSCGGSVENHFTKMSNAISTTGYSDVKFQFALLTINNGTNYGALYYSLDNGTTWTQKESNFAATTSWTEMEFTDPAWDNASSLLFGFSFYTGLGSFISGTNSPALSIDNVKIIGTGSAVSVPTIATDALTTTSFCNGSATTLTVPFTVTGEVNTTNVYNAYLSDATGSFANATLIGTLTSGSNGSLSINATIPQALTAGNAYRVRVQSTDPIVIGSDNGTNITIVDAPTVTATAANATICAGNSTTITASGATDYSWSPATGLSATTGSTVTANPAETTTYTVTGTTDGCSAYGTVIITVDPCAGIEDITSSALTIYPNPVENTLFIQNNGDFTIISTSILDLSGRIIETYVGFTTAISTSKLESGNYLLLIQHENGTSVQSFTKK